MSNEVKIGLLALITLGLSYWGYKFIIGSNILSKSNLYYVEYEDVDRMQIGTPVVIYGVERGSVANLEVLYDKKKVLVTLDMAKSEKLPKNTKAIIKSAGFMGGKTVELAFDIPCTGTDCAQSGDYLIGETRGMVASMMSKDELDSFMESIEVGIKPILDTLNNALLNENSNSPIAKSIKDLQQTLSNFRSASFKLDVAVNKSTDKIDGALTHLVSITGELDSKKEKIGNIIDNADNLMQQIGEVDIKQSVAKANKAIDELGASLAGAQTAISEVSNLIGELKNGQGTLGKLLQDEQLYNDLKELSSHTDSLINDFQERPYRYMPLKSRNRVKRYDKLDQNSGN